MSFNQKQRVLICGLDHEWESFSFLIFSKLNGFVCFSTSDQSIRKYFSRFGTISHCSIKRDLDGKSQGFGNVTFKGKHETCFDCDNKYFCYIESSSTKDCMRSDSHTIDGK